MPLETHEEILANLSTNELVKYSLALPKTALFVARVLFIKYDMETNIRNYLLFMKAKTNKRDYLISLLTTDFGKSGNATQYVFLLKVWLVHLGAQVHDNVIIYNQEEYLLFGSEFNQILQEINQNLDLFKIYCDLLEIKNLETDDLRWVGTGLLDMDSFLDEQSLVLLEYVENYSMLLSLSELTNHDEEVNDQINNCKEAINTRQDQLYSELKFQEIRADWTKFSFIYKNKGYFFWRETDSVIIDNIKNLSPTIKFNAIILDHSLHLDQCSYPINHIYYQIVDKSQEGKDYQFDYNVNEKILKFERVR